MSSGLPSDEVAEDYKNSLEDLTMNSRYEISNLTVIAKENTEHAMAISRVLENHIRNLDPRHGRNYLLMRDCEIQAPPNRKLPALYVLDSVVKNVGTPYTLFLGRNLYQTFMNAYTLVDGQIRKKLDEMLKTWKEPVPGSMDTRPVFPAEITRTIENALIKAKTAAVQQQQQQAKSQQELFGRGRSTATPPVTWRNTPTPPQNLSRFAPPSKPPGYVSQSPYGTNGTNQYQNHQSTPAQFPSQYPSQPSPLSYQRPAGYMQIPQPMESLDTLNNDISNLISNARAEFALNPYDQGVQQKLKALLDLQNILQSQQLPPDQIGLIRAQVAQLSTPVQPTPAPLPVAAPAPLVPQPTTQQSSQQWPVNLQSLFSSNALAELLASSARSQQPTPLPPKPPMPVPQPAAPINQRYSTPTPAPAGGENSLLASLRAAGMLPPATGTPTITPALPANLPFALPVGTPNFPTPPVPIAAPTRPPLADIQNDVDLTSASLKVPRPQLINSLYEAQPNQCTTCGRRFVANQMGKEKKARHLDWHFRTNQRMADAARRGQNRSWYLDMTEWINSRETDEGQENSDGLGNANADLASQANAAAKNDPKSRYIPTPNDPALANLHCPICQEKFETVWHSEAQEWVWMDAAKVGSRIYHASCYDEASKEGGGLAARGLTPEPVLGKRKAEDGDLNALRARLKKEVLA
ncbi:MAG: hypothetical protein M1819_001583 [Sarea resinae]|nr:MAG: hypothetical protein M1819_001583 [Sarea resinae]